MLATGRDIAKLLEAIRQGGAGVVTRKSAAAMMSDQTGPLLGGDPGWSFGFGGAVLIDPSLANTPQSAGAWQWSGAYGNSWFVDPVKRLTVVMMGNTAPDGDWGAFPVSIRNAIYGK